jgi:hypothetical protein
MDITKGKELVESPNEAMWSNLPKENKEETADKGRNIVPLEPTSNYIVFRLIGNPIRRYRERERALKE